MKNWFLEQELQKRGYDYKLSGTFYLREAATLAARGPGYKMVTKDIYPGIARAAGVRPSAVEKSIREAVHKAEPGKSNATAIHELAAVIRCYED